MIQKILGKEIEKKIFKEPSLVAVITYLIAKWIERNHPQKEYSLVVKKGLNFVMKQTDNF